MDSSTETQFVNAFQIISSMTPQTSIIIYKKKKNILLF